LAAAFRWRECVAHNPGFPDAVLAHQIAQQGTLGTNRAIRFLVPADEFLRSLTATVRNGTSM
jgi:hypothetical protein